MIVDAANEYMKAHCTLFLCMFINFLTIKSKKKCFALLIRVCFTLIK